MQPSHVIHPTTARERLRRRIGLIVAGFVVLGLFVSGLAIQQNRFEQELDRVKADASQQERSADRDVDELEGKLGAAGPIDVRQVIEDVAPSVFTIASRSGQGSGFAVLRVDDGVLVATNHHVVAEAVAREDGRVVLLLGERRRTGKVWATDEESDLALVRVEDTDIPVLGSSWTRGERPDVGDEVVAYGTPLGIDEVATSGVISQLREGAVLSDVSVNPGNSGGPLLDRNGDVVGVVSASLEARGGSGLALAIQFPYVCRLALATDRSVRGCDGMSSPRD